METTKVKVINKSCNPLPEYSTTGSAGMDLRADLGDKGIDINPRERIAIPTGLYIQLPKGKEAQIRPRSGLAYKYGITVLNSPGTIDADYTGEIKVILINKSDSVFHVNSGDRICQMVITDYDRAEFELVDQLDDTERGEGGLGHTGKA